MTNVPGTFTEEQRELRSLAQRFLTEHSTSEHIRTHMETAEGFDESLWKQMAELGWMGISIPEEYGGAGYSFVETSILLEEMGRALLTSPFLFGAVVGPAAFANAATDEQKARILPGVADGSYRLTLARTEPSGRWDQGGVTLTATKSGDGYALNGTKMFIVDGHTATHLIVVGRIDGELAFFLVDGDADGITKTPLVTLDPTRKQAKLEFENTPAELLGTGPVGPEVLEKTLAQGVTAQAAEAVGGAQWCLDTATEHAKTRVQFGRPIGSFQAVKHKCAEMLIEVEMAKSAAYYASWTVAEDDNELLVASSLAKAYAAEAYFHTAASAIQVLGGIGFTWEHDVHLHLRRAKSTEVYLGDGDYHRELVFKRTEGGS